ncbi:endonuclease V [Magnetococcales bacterium HHB-1]
MNIFRRLYSHFISKEVHTPTTDQSIEAFKETAHRYEEKHKKNLSFIAPPITEIKYVVGVDVAYRGDVATTCALLFKLGHWTPIEVCYHTSRTDVPYIPGYFSFREGPPVIETLKKLKKRFDLIIIDGQGTAHPRKFGLACDVGLQMDKPTIGCGKSRLCGTYDALDQQQGSYVPLNNPDRIGSVLRTVTGVKPVFISPGHKTNHDFSIQLIMQCVTRYRVPEPTRLADIYLRKWMKEHSDHQA